MYFSYQQKIQLCSSWYGLDTKGTVPVVHSAPVAHSSELLSQLKEKFIELGKEKATQYLGYIKCSLKIGCQYKKKLSKYNIT